MNHEVDIRTLGSDHEIYVDGERGSTCRGMSFLEACEAFAANHPEHAQAIDALAADHRDVLGEPQGAPRTARAAKTRSPKRGSGARFRELYGEGKTNAQALEIVRREFPDSKATLSDAAWNRARWRKENGEGCPSPLDCADVL